MFRQVNRIPSSLILTRYLFFLNAAVWLVFGAWTVARMMNDESEMLTTPLVISILMVGNAAAMVVSGIIIGRLKRVFFFFAVLVLLVNILLTFTDQFGFFDLVTLILDFTLVILLVINGRAFR